MLFARFGWFVIGTVGFYLMRPGIVPWWEAAQRGMLVSLVALLVETTVKLAASASRKWLLRLVFVALLLFAIPLVAALHPLHTVPKRTPASFGLPFEDVRFRTTDGLTLAGWVIPAEPGRGNVIFCHGHGRNRGHVAGLLPTLHDLGLNVLAFDFRGHGDSEGHCSTFGFREVTDLVAAEAYLRQRFPGKPLFLVGVSLGAAVSLQALPYLPHVRGVWSEGSFARFSDVAANKFRWVPDGLINSLMQLYYRVGWLDTGFWGPSANPVDCMRGVSVPVYFCHAEKDELVPLAQGTYPFLCPGRTRSGTGGLLMPTITTCDRGIEASTCGDYGGSLSISCLATNRQRVLEVAEPTPCVHPATNLPNPAIPHRPSNRPNVAGQEQTILAPSRASVPTPRNSPRTRWSSRVLRPAGNKRPSKRQSPGGDLVQNEAWQAARWCPGPEL